MDPFTWTAIIMAASAATSATGAIISGQQQNAAAKNQSQIYENNRLQSLANATEEDKARFLEQNAQKSIFERVKGQQESAASASGLQLNGSVFDVMTDSALQSHADRESTRIGSQNRIAGLLGQASDFSAQASMSRAAGRNAVASSYWGAGGTLLSGAGSAMYMGASRPAGSGGFSGQYRDNASQLVRR